MTLTCKIIKSQYDRGMKTCTFCKEVKPLSEFNKNKSRKDGLQNKCRPCSQTRFKEYYASNKEHHRSVVMANTVVRLDKVRDAVVDYLKLHPCVDCGASDIRVLEFDHLPGFDKVMEVSRMIASGSGLERIFQEIAKCEVRCRNCHAIKTYERMGKTWHDKYIMGV